jgi:hypothetical protein
LSYAEIVGLLMVSVLVRETGRQLALLEGRTLVKPMANSFQGSELGAGGSFHKASDHKAPDSAGTDAALTCTSFG